ncbi:CCA tRNA nucleotidyltransferase [Alloprevotella sp. Lung230]|uniref:CCA tRNA nucleotidyltransferase n=1 Tax=Alloprevotella sp. Lung230 TaxID=2766595 RepID=UPI0016560C11|nr:HD domain-containing protein [Alloprevotella sp. Lung230]MBC8625234.1 HD domain-containing protein [Alloprevotella sp. Lung230]
MKMLTQAEFAQRLSAPIFQQLSATVDALGVEAYIVGGYVRDLLLERPSKDVDIVVVGSGIEVAQAFARRLGKGAHCSVFRNFGTAQVKWHHRVEHEGENRQVEEEIEFVGARKESYSHDSRKPIVEDGTLDDDQRRRDFTINALALCLNKARFAELVDPFDGLLDLEDGIIATPLDPDITFSDDPLRMMRCIRFATQLNFQIEAETFEALARNKERIGIISGERIIDELNKIMLAPYPSKGFIDLHRCGLLDIILPELTALDIVEERNGRKHKNNFYHTLEVLENLVARQAEIEAQGKTIPHDHKLYLRWATLLHDIGKPRSKRWDAKVGWTFHNHNYLGMRMVKPLFRRLKLPLDERLHYVERLVDLHMRPINIADDGVTDSAVRRLLFEAGDDIDDLMMLCEADITSKNERRKRGFHENYRLVRQKLVDLEEKDRIRNFQPPVNGDEIMRLFNLRPCAEIGALKSALKDAILDGVVPNEHDAALAFIVERAKRMGLIPVVEQS